MLIQCPDCQTKMKPTPPSDTKPGTKVVVKCRCGTELRFTMPGKPKPTGSEIDWLNSNSFKDIFGAKP